MDNRHVGGNGSDNGVLEDLRKQLERGETLYDSAEDNSAKIEMMKLVMELEGKIQEEEYKERLMEGEE